MLEELRIKAEAALDSGDMASHMKYGLAYHALAAAILRMTGIDPRPEEA